MTLGLKIKKKAYGDRGDIVSKKELEGAIRNRRCRRSSFIVGAEKRL